MKNVVRVVVVFFSLFIIAAPSFAQGRSWEHRPPIAIDEEGEDYSLNFTKWWTRNVPYYINVVSCSITGLDPARILHDIEAAASVWELQSQADIHPYFAGTTSRTGFNSSDHLNTVSCDPGYNPLSPRAVATTQSIGLTSGRRLDSDIVMWLGNNYGAYPYLTRDLSCGKGVYFLDIAAHEFGHMMGLSHSAYTAATMYYQTTSCSTKEETLYWDDILGIEKLYP